MRRITYSGLFALAAATALVAGCASAPDKKDYSGYLGDYSDLKEEKAPGGLTVMRYVSPKATPANYNAVILQKVAFYPKPEPTDQLTQKSIDEIGNYLNQTLREKIEAKVKVTDTPGPGVANVRWAVTAVTPEKMGLKPYQYVPFAFIGTMASRGISGTPEEAKIVIEAEGTDSVSKEILLKVVRAGTGEELKKNQEGKPEVTLDAVKPLIDKWTDSVAAGVTQFVKAK